MARIKTIDGLPAENSLTWNVFCVLYHYDNLGLCTLELCLTKLKNLKVVQKKHILEVLHHNAVKTMIIEKGTKAHPLFKLTDKTKEMMHTARTSRKTYLRIVKECLNYV